MIGNPKWFQRRKYGGWGLTPASWQGWVYIAVMAVFLFGVQLIIPDQFKTWTMIVVAVVFSLDLLDIMVHLKNDERETTHEALAERNASWAMVAILAFGIAFQTARNSVDPFLIIVLIAGVIAKAATNWYLRDK